MASFHTRDPDEKSLRHHARSFDSGSLVFRFLAGRTTGSPAVLPHEALCDGRRPAQRLDGEGLRPNQGGIPPAAAATSVVDVASARGCSVVRGCDAGHGWRPGPLLCVHVTRTRRCQVAGVTAGSTASPSLVASEIVRRAAAMAARSGAVSSRPGRRQRYPGPLASSRHFVSIARCLVDAKLRPIGSIGSRNSGLLSNADFRDSRFRNGELLFRRAAVIR